MKRLLMAMVVALLPTAAFGFSDSPRAASADYILSGCTRVNIPPVGDVLQCPNGLGQFMLHRTFPTEATGPTVNITIRRYSPDGSPSGVFSDQVCLAVVKPGQNPANGTAFIALACSLFANETASNNLTVTNLLGVNPVDVNGTPCAGSACAGAELYILVQKNAGGSTNNIAYFDLTLGYQ